MDFYQEPNADNVGAKPRLKEVYLTTHGAVTAGNIYAMDISTATAANLGQATDSKAGPDGALEANVWVVAQESKASGEACRFAVEGYVRILAGSGGLSAAAAGSADGSAGIITAPAGDIVIALVPAAISATEYGYAWFKGTGFYAKHG
jgi:hypothetical protein